MKGMPPLLLPLLLLLLLLEAGAVLSTEGEGGRSKGAVGWTQAQARTHARSYIR